jgi:hypothetical protein
MHTPAWRRPGNPRVSKTRVGQGRRPLREGPLEDITGATDVPRGARSDAGSRPGRVARSQEVAPELLVAVVHNAGPEADRLHDAHRLKPPGGGAVRRVRRSRVGAGRHGTHQRHAPTRVGSVADHMSHLEVSAGASGTRSLEPRRAAPGRSDSAPMLRTSAWGPARCPPSFDVSGASEPLPPSASGPFFGMSRLSSTDRRTVATMTCIADDAPRRSVGRGAERQAVRHTSRQPARSRHCLATTRNPPPKPA